MILLDDNNLVYPIGRFDYGKEYTLAETRKHIERIGKLPKQLKKAFKSAKPGELDKQYRPNGWTARQVIHHIADSHMNAYIRCKLAMTEERPVIRPYNQNAWAELPDASDGGVKMSLEIIEAVHKRWTYFLSALSEADFQREYVNPESKRVFKLAEVVALYAWHGKHHLRHVELAIGNFKGKDDSDEYERPEDNGKVSTSSRLRTTTSTAASNGNNTKKKYTKPNTLTIATIERAEASKPTSKVKKTSTAVQQSEVTVTKGKSKKKSNLSHKGKEHSKPKTTTFSDRLVKTVIIGPQGIETEADIATATRITSSKKAKKEKAKSAGKKKAQQRKGKK